MKQTMTHNQYQEFLKKNASRLYTEPGYTMDDYQRDADSVTILGFELDKFNLTDEMKAVINNAFAAESTNKHGNMYVSGHYHTFSFVNGVADALGCENVCHGAYNGFYKNNSARLVLEYCEGDVSLILCETNEAYRNEIKSYNKFYRVEPKEMCVQVYFDGVHMDNVRVPEEDVEVVISSLVQHGYDNYNGDVKEDWERDGGRSNPDMSFKVVEYPEKTLDAVLVDANERSAETGCEVTGKDEYVKE